MLHADVGMFDRHLSTIVDLIVPHRMNLSDDPFEVIKNGWDVVPMMWHNVCCSALQPIGWLKPLIRALRTPIGGGLPLLLSMVLHQPHMVNLFTKATIWSSPLR